MKVSEELMREYYYSDKTHTKVNKILEFINSLCSTSEEQTVAIMLMYHGLAVAMQSSAIELTERGGNH